MTRRTADRFGIETTWTEGESILRQRAPGEAWRTLTYASPAEAGEAFEYVDDRSSYGRGIAS